MNLLAEGSQAPSFALADKDNATHRLEDIGGTHIILFFYPKDNTPGCTIEARTFSKDLEKFTALKTRVVGISGGDAKSKQKFCAQNNLKVLLLSDPDYKVARKYGVYGEKFFMGRSYLGISRTTFILDKKGKVVKVFEKVKPETHAEEVLEFLLSTRAKKPTTKKVTPAKKASTKKRPIKKRALKGEG